jgi:hypothetical protein
VNQKKKILHGPYLLFSQALTALLADVGHQLDEGAAQWPPTVLQLQTNVHQMKEQLFHSIFGEFKRYLHDMTSSEALAATASVVGAPLAAPLPPIPTSGVGAPVVLNCSLFALVVSTFCVCSGIYLS